MEHPIAAVATAPGKAAIGILRLSGEGCIAAAARVFKPLDGSAFGAGAPRSMVLGELLDAQGNPIDQAMAFFSPAPHSYTGEDTAEFHCHGSPALLALGLEALFAQGVRQAGPGEFTRRAFLNGKLDLLQAESVADLIDAQTAAAVRGAAGQLGGELSRRVAEVYDSLVDLMAHFHAALDYPDEDIALFDDATIQTALNTAETRLESLLATYQRGRLRREGVPTAIVGLPNVGKSSLLNALVGYDRAIVTPIPGTTRDTVEETCVLGDVLLRLTDTAGLRNTGDTVERLGVERAKAAMESAALILVVVDSSREMSPEELALLDEAKALSPTVLIWNKSDLTQAPRPETDLHAVEVSALTGDGLDALEEAVSRLLPQGTDGGEALLTNLRQAEAAREALEAVRRAKSAENRGVPADFLLTDVEEALAALGELTGRNVREDTVSRIFSRFCVGK